MRYFKLTDGRLAEYSGPQMGAAWHAAEGWLPYVGTLGTDWLYVDGDGAIAELSAEEYATLHPVVPAEIADKEKFIIAVRALVQPETVSAVMQNIQSLMAAIFSISMLTTGAAPGNDINLLHPEVTNFLTLAGLTLDQVKNKMAEV